MGDTKKGQQKIAETEEGTVQIQEGAVATGEDPTSVAIASIQSAATFPDPNVKYVFRTENGGQVREGARWLQMPPGVWG